MDRKLTDTCHECGEVHYIDDLVAIDGILYCGKCSQKRGTTI